MKRITNDESGLGIIAVIAIIGAVGGAAGIPKAQNPPPSDKERIVQLERLVRRLNFAMDEVRPASTQVKVIQAAPKRITPNKGDPSIKRALIKARDELRNLEHPSSKK